MVERTARCACGKLRLTCEGEPVRVSVCHCTQCQRRTGSAFGVGAYFPNEAVKRIAGAVKEFARACDAGRWLRFSFCPECGTTVHWRMEMWPGGLGVAVGAFADPAFPPPHAVVWAENKAPWVPDPEGVPVFARAQQS
jgi:hypothetical protein